MRDGLDILRQVALLLGFTVFLGCYCADRAGLLDKNGGHHLGVFDTRCMASSITKAQTGLARNYLPL